MPNINSQIDEVRLQNQKLRILIEGLKESVLILDTQQNVIEINKTALGLLEYEYNEVIQKKVTDFLYLIDSEDKPIDANLYCPQGGIDMEGTIFKAANVSLVDRNKTIKVVNFESRKINEGSKINLGAILILSNVFMESELERMKVDFVSMSVHVLRTPLTIVRGYLSRMLTDKIAAKLDPSELDTLRSATAGAEELNVLVENLLHLSEIQKGTFMIHPTLINYESVVATVSAQLKPLAEQKGLKLLYIPSVEKLPMVTADFSRIKEVLTNLIENSIKFTDTGGVEISLRKEDGVIHTFIKDTGKGIAEANLRYIFTKFYRIKDPLAMDAGQGLGLYVSKKIIDSHNGDIWAESIEGQGSIFHFTLPIL